MNLAELNISRMLLWEDGLPRPQWDQVNAQIGMQLAPDDQAQAWTEAARQWLKALGFALGDHYETSESDHFLVLASSRDGVVGPLLRFAEHCREAPLTVLKDLAHFDVPGKQVIVAVRTADEYYRYISLYLPEGE
jgi:hypothetical protein